MTNPIQTPPGNTIDRALRIFADVRPGEGGKTLLLALNLFLILTAYYVLKPVREALILGEGSPELKAYLSAAQVAVLLVAVPAYGRLVTHLSRAKQAIDAFFFRMGDVCAAVLVFAGTSIGLSASGFAKANIAMAVMWLAAAWLVGQAYARRQPTPRRPGRPVTPTPKTQMVGKALRG